MAIGENHVIVADSNVVFYDINFDADFLDQHMFQLDQDYNLWC